MSELLEWMKEVYIKIKSGDFEWKPMYPNNVLCNTLDGVYTDMFFEHDGKYQYIKYSIQYQSRCDQDGLSHPEEGTAYYILHELRLFDLEEKFVIPEPNDKFELENDLAHMVNSYGRFRYAFSDEETAKKVVTNELVQMLYPYTYILSESEIQEWNKFVDENDI